MRERREYAETDMNAQRRPAEPAFQRNALAPGILAAIVLILSPLFADGTAAMIVRYAVAILALIVGWFALQARQWWWTIVFVAVAVFWNPIFPFPVDPVVWSITGVVAALAFLTAGALVKTERSTP